MNSCFRAVSPMSVTDLHDLVGSIITMTSDLSHGKCVVTG